MVSSLNTTGRLYQQFSSSGGIGMVNALMVLGVLPETSEHAIYPLMGSESPLGASMPEMNSNGSTAAPPTVAYFEYPQFGSVDSLSMVGGPFDAPFVNNGPIGSAQAFDVVGRMVLSQTYAPTLIQGNTGEQLLLPGSYRITMGAFSPSVTIGIIVTQDTVPSVTMSAKVPSIFQQGTDTGMDGDWDPPSWSAHGMMP